jgi:murein DD-endopeptidase MepM/ murein hydrolase activator NlpD
MSSAASRKEGFAAKQRSHKSARIMVLLVGGVLSGALFTVAIAALSFVRSRGIERVPPQIIVEEKGKVISSKGVSFPLSVRDDESGLERIVVWIQQSGKVTEVFRQSLARDKVFSTSVEIAPNSIDLSPGELVLIIEATDGSMWRNKTQRVVPLTIDNDPPRIDIFARSEAISVGEIGVVGYRVTDGSEYASGVHLHYAKNEEEKFDGITGRDVDSDLSAPGVYVSFFTASRSCPLKSAVEAVDQGGNVSQRPIAVECKSPSLAKGHSQIVSSQDIIRRAEELAAGDSSWGEALRAEISRSKADGAKKERAAAVTVARYLLDTARSSDYEEVVKATRTSIGGSRSWRGAARFGVFVLKAGFGDSIELADSQGVLAKMPLRGVEMVPAQPGFSVVFAPYRGVVRLSRKLGVLGEVIVVDHGAGISSFFYSLESRYVEAGAQIAEGQQIGRIGDSGFHFSKALRMQFLLQGVPFDPGILTDMQRFYANIELPLNDLRAKFGVSSPRIPKVMKP